MIIDYWNEGVSQYCALEPHLQIKWLSEFSGELTQQFRMISQLGESAETSIEKLDAINEIFHQVFHAIGSKSQNYPSPISDAAFLEILKKSTRDIGIDMDDFLKRISDLDYLKHAVH